MDRILPLFDTHTPLRGQFLYHKCGQKQTFVHVVIESPLGGKTDYCILDVMCRQQIKLFHVISTSEFHLMDGTTLKEFFWFLWLSAGLQKLEHKVDHNYFTGKV